MMNFFCLNKNTFRKAQFTERMLTYILVSDSFPGSAVSSLGSRVSAILFIAFVFFLFMLLTESSLCQIRTARVGARTLRTSWHFFLTSCFGHKKSPQRIAPLKAGIILLFADYTISHYTHGHFRTNVDISGVFIFLINFPVMSHDQVPVRAIF